MRSQIKAILSKTNLGTQTNLVRYMGFLQRYENGPQHYAGNGVGSGDAPGLASDFFTLSTGRTMAYTVLGPPEGRPVLFIHGMIDSTRLPQKTVDDLYRRNINGLDYGCSDRDARWADVSPATDTEHFALE